MNGSEKGSLRRPLHEEFRPILPVKYIFWEILLLVPEDADAFASEHYHLISTAGIAKPPPQMVLLCKIINMRFMVFVVNATLSAVSFNVRQFVDCKCVLLVERRAV